MKVSGVSVRVSVKKNSNNKTQFVISEIIRIRHLPLESLLSNCTAEATFSERRFRKSIDPIDFLLKK